MNRILHADRMETLRARMAALQRDPFLAPLVKRLLAPADLLEAMAREVSATLADDRLAGARLEHLITLSAPLQIPRVVIESLVGNEPAVDESRQGLLHAGRLVLLALSASRIEPDPKGAELRVNSVFGLAVALGPAEGLASAMADGLDDAVLEKLLAALAGDRELAAERLVLPFFLAGGAERRRWTRLEALRRLVLEGIGENAWDAATVDGILTLEPSDADPDALEIRLGPGLPEVLARDLDKDLVNVVFAPEDGFPEPRPVRVKTTRVSDGLRLMPPTSSGAWVGLTSEALAERARAYRAALARIWGARNQKLPALRNEPVPLGDLSDPPDPPWPPRRVHWPSGAPRVTDERMRVVLVRPALLRDEADAAGGDETFVLRDVSRRFARVLLARAREATARAQRSLGIAIELIEPPALSDEALLVPPDPIEPARGFERLDRLAAMMPGGERDVWLLLVPDEVAPKGQAGDSTGDDVNAARPIPVLAPGNAAAVLVIAGESALEAALRTAADAWRRNPARKDTARRLRCLAAFSADGGLTLDSRIDEARAAGPGAPEQLDVLAHWFDGRDRPVAQPEHLHGHRLDDAAPFAVLLAIPEGAARLELRRLDDSVLARLARRRGVLGVSAVRLEGARVTWTASASDGMPSEQFVEVLGNGLWATVARLTRSVATHSLRRGRLSGGLGLRVVASDGWTTVSTESASTLEASEGRVALRAAGARLFWADSDPEDGTVEWSLASARSTRPPLPAGRVRAVLVPACFGGRLALELLGHGVSDTVSIDWEVQRAGAVL